jgi:hypothetical protein
MIDATLIKEWGLDSSRIDGMKTGMFRNSSYWGKQTNKLKSGICKYTRRAMWDKLVWCVVEMAIIGTKSRGIFTNLVNRMKILVMEELICFELGEIDGLVSCVEEADGRFESDFGGCLEKLVEFCRRLEGLARGRVISYMNNWWRFVDKKFKLDEVAIDKVEKYKKEGDSEELLKLGELFIDYLETGNEKIFAIYNKLYNMDGKFGRRYRRRDAVYLLLEIVEDHYCGENEQFKRVFNFGLGMFHRKQMTERRAFGIWILMMAWKFSSLKISCKEVEVSTECIREYMITRGDMEINEDFVVNDYHVDKAKNSLAKFATEGAFVLDEDLSILGENGAKYKKLYIDVKNGKTPKKIYKFKRKTNVGKKASSKTEAKASSKTEAKPETITNHLVKEADLELVDWERFSEVKVLEAGVCGMKVCCMKVVFEGKNFILKEMRKSFNSGRDYMLVDVLKTKFGVKDLGMCRIRSNVALEVVDKKKNSMVGNWKFGKKEVVYCMMDDFENVGDLGKNKSFLDRDDVFYQALKIRLYDGLFRSSDNILRNILVNSSGEVLSIDEGDIYGKRTAIFNKTDWFKKKEVVAKTREVAKKIISEWKLEEKVEMVKEEMERWGFGAKVDEMTKRFKEFGEIVENELK